MNGLRIAKSGYDAEVETDPNRFIFHDSYNTFKILKSGTATPTLSASGSEQVYQIAHGLTRAPFVFAFCKFVSGRVGPPGCKSNNVNFWFTRVTVDATNINLYYFNGTGGNYAPTFKYLACEVPIV